METSKELPVQLMHPPAAAEHQWLHRLLGDWLLVESSEPIDPAATPWTERGERIGDLWVTLRGRGDMPDGKSGMTVMTLGYDIRAGAFVGNWVGSMMANQWVYRGFRDTDRDAIVLEAEGPDFNNPERTLRYRDTIEFRSDDERVLRGLVQGEDGEWTEFMWSVYRRSAAHTE
jgi:hypothetical protein